MEVYHEPEEREPNSKAQYITRTSVMIGGLIVVVFSIVMIGAKVAQYLYGKLF